MQTAAPSSSNDFTQFEFLQSTTKALFRQARSVTSGGQWWAALTKAYSLRQEHSAQQPLRKRQETGHLRLILLTATILQTNSGNLTLGIRKELVEIVTVEEEWFQRL
jgi:hypothetical protein